MKIHHGYIGFALILWCLLTVNRIGVIGEFNLYVWSLGLLLGILLFFHDLYKHLTDRKG
ncbi:hypothetical protein H5T51_08605 [Candidatus Bathyarchaeota archaeon]|nr:hypothetical protein [Candidatus Bathyarchaeota archaeon]